MGHHLAMACLLLGSTLAGASLTEHCADLVLCWEDLTVAGCSAAAESVAGAAEVQADEKALGYCSEPSSHQGQGHALNGHQTSLPLSWEALEEFGGRLPAEVEGVVSSAGRQERFAAAPVAVYAADRIVGAGRTVGAGLVVQFCQSSLCGSCPKDARPPPAAVISPLRVCRPSSLCPWLPGGGP